MKKKVIYLSSPLDKTTEEERKWIGEARNLLGEDYEVLSPEMFGPQQMAPISDIVNKDLGCIMNADCVIAYMFRHSIGTSMEIMEASNQGKVVIVIAKMYPVSPWLHYYSDCVCSTIEDGVKVAKALLK